MLQFLESKLYSDVEGTCSGQFGYIIAVISILDIGKGMGGNGQAEFITRYRAIVFKPFKGEVVNGVGNNVNKVRGGACRGFIIWILKLTSIAALCLHHTAGRPSPGNWIALGKKSVNQCTNDTNKKDVPSRHSTPPIIPIHNQRSESKRKYQYHEPEEEPTSLEPGAPMLTSSIRSHPVLTRRIRDLAVLRSFIPELFIVPTGRVGG
jgi:hypothetical protein